MTYAFGRGLRAALLLTLSGAVGAVMVDRLGPIASVQAQSEQDKKKEREKRERDRKPPERRATPPPAPKASTPPPAAVEKRLPPPERKDTFRRRPTDQESPSFKVQPAPRQVSPSGPEPVQPYGGPKGPPAATKSAPEPSLAPKFVAPTRPKRFEEIQKHRLERVEEGGKRKIIQEPGNRFIVKQGNRAVIRHDESERFARKAGAKSETRRDGSVETVYIRLDGVRIVTVVDGNGRLIRRYRRDRDGRERNIIDNRAFYRGLGVGVAVGVLGIIALNLPPPRITIPRERYILDYDSASEDDLEEALDAPPLETLERAYSLEEIRDNYELRARLRRVDVDTINFESGSWEVDQDQEFKLERIARAILRVLERNPEAVIFIEGHTDAVGPTEDNLSLSDRRAQAVAEVLSERFDVPAENLVSQGYGEQFLKVDTQGPERLNRRVTFLNIAGLMAER